MRPKRFFILFVMALCCVILPVSASRLGDIRMNARFLTDRMAYELRLSNRQYNDIFEINYDFFYNVDPYIDRMSYGDPYALDMYYRYLDERNDDIRWVLSRKHYVRFMKLEHFFLPIYAINRVCYIRVYNIYPNRTHFYYGRPTHYHSYHGGHCRHHHGGISFYQRNYRQHYHHTVYTGHYKSVRTRTRVRDFPKVESSHRPTTYPSVRPSTRPTDRRPGYNVVHTDRPHRGESVRHRGESVRHSNEYVGHRTESVRHRSETVRKASETPRNRSSRTTVGERNSSRHTNQTSTTTSTSERSERRGVRQR